MFAFYSCAAPYARASKWQPTPAFTYFLYEVVCLAVYYTKDPCSCLLRERYWILQQLLHNDKNPLVCVHEKNFTVLRISRSIVVSIKSKSGANGNLDLLKKISLPMIMQKNGLGCRCWKEEEDRYTCYALIVMQTCGNGSKGDARDMPYNPMQCI